MIIEDKEFEKPSINFAMGVLLILYGILACNLGTKEAPRLVARSWGWFNSIRKVIGGEAVCIILLFLGLTLIWRGIKLIKKKRHKN